MNEFIVKSTSPGSVTFRVADAAKTVVAKILSPPPEHPEAVNVGLTTKNELPEKFNFRLSNLQVWKNVSSLIGFSS